MAKAILKTQKTTDSVAAFIKSVEPSRQSDCKAIIKLMRKATGSKPAMWGKSIIGFGNKHLKYASGRELDWFTIGFSPRKGDISLYVLMQSEDQSGLLKKLGPHKAGKGCLYIKSLEAIDQNVLCKLMDSTVKAMKKV